MDTWTTGRSRGRFCSKAPGTGNRRRIRLSTLEGYWSMFNGYQIVALHQSNFPPNLNAKWDEPVVHFWTLKLSNLGPGQYLMSLWTPGDAGKGWDIDVTLRQMESAKSWPPHRRKHVALGVSLRWSISKQYDHRDCSELTERAGSQNDAKMTWHGLLHEGPTFAY